MSEGKVSKELKLKIQNYAAEGHSAADITEIINAGLEEADQLKEGTVGYHVGKYRKSLKGSEVEETEEESVDESAWVAKELHDQILDAKNETIRLLNGIVDKLLAGKSA